LAWQSLTGGFLKAPGERRKSLCSAPKNFSAKKMRSCSLAGRAMGCSFQSRNQVK
jgi:hypothetical protein